MDTRIYLSALCLSIFYTSSTQCYDDIGLFPEEVVDVCYIYYWLGTVLIITVRPSVLRQ